MVVWLLSDYSDKLSGYQFDYVFDWTMLKYPQVGANPRSRVNIFTQCTLNFLNALKESFRQDYLVCMVFG